jgi:hypothetical protein
MITNKILSIEFPLIKETKNISNILFPDINYSSRVALHENDNFISRNTNFAVPNKKNLFNELINHCNAGIEYVEPTETKYKRLFLSDPEQNPEPGENEDDDIDKMQKKLDVEIVNLKNKIKSIRVARNTYYSKFFNKDIKFNQDDANVINKYSKILLEISKIENNVISESEKKDKSSVVEKKTFPDLPDLSQLSPEETKTELNKVSENFFLSLKNILPFTS